MKEQPWKVLLMFVMPEVKGVIPILEAAGCKVISGRSSGNKTTKEDELVDSVRDVDALMVSAGEIINRRVLEAAKRLKVVSKLGVGVDQIDVKAATDLGILVANTPTEDNYLPMSEYAVAMILALAKNFKLADQNARLRLWRSTRLTCLRNKTVGIVGLGRIGSRVAKLLSSFEVRLLASDPYVSPDKAKTLGVALTDLPVLMKESDFVTLHVVLTPETRGLIGEAELRMMKPTAYLVNTARGGLINEDALVKALKENWIAGAGLDVFDPEVPRPDHPLFEKELYFRTLYSPHSGGLDPEYAWRLITVWKENCLSALREEIPQYVVNPKAIPAWQERLKLL